MRVRIPIAVVFVLSCLPAGYLGLKHSNPVTNNQDKLLHVAVFFLLTVLFYWSIDTHRKRAVNITLVVCCAFASIGSEFLQHFATRGQRRFDLQDIAANLVGSIFATVLSSLYHGRLTERRKNARYERMRQDLESAQQEEEELAEIDPETAPTQGM